MLLLSSLFTVVILVLHFPCSMQSPESFSFRKDGMTDESKLSLREKASSMFQFGYDNYMRHAFPEDELDPIHCTGRGHDEDDIHNININDALGDYMLTLVDSLDTLVVMGKTDEFKRAISLVVENLSFNNNNQVQVFEATIRVLGGLISAHLLIKDADQPFGDIVPDEYDDELLALAHDLATRLLPAFSQTKTGIPYPRVNLRDGIEPGSCLYCINETCSAGAASLLLEFGTLSILLKDPVYYSVASRSVEALWSRRSSNTGLIGNVINIQTGEWVGTMAGIGAGIDSVYEYLLKSAIMFGDRTQIEMFEMAYQNVTKYMRKGRAKCNSGEGLHPLYINVNIQDGSTSNYWIDSLSAAWPAVQVLYGDVEEAVCTHLLFYYLWRKYDALPERYNWNTNQPELNFYPLRPELAESTYYLYRATKSPFYLDVGKNILDSIEKYNKVKCGYATLHDVIDKTLEDRMESFFLSETCKYLYLLFDEENALHMSNSPSYLFTTEGHLLPIKNEFRKVLADMLDKAENFYFNTNSTGWTKSFLPQHSYFPIDENYIYQLFQPTNS